MSEVHVECGDEFTAGPDEQTRSRNLIRAAYASLTG